MGRLIDVDKFKADCGMADDCEDCKQNASLCQYDIIYSKMDFCGWLDDAPTVDAVPVVRCKDCIHWGKFPVSTVLPQYHKCGMATYKSTKGDDFCSDGRDSDPEPLKGGKNMCGYKIFSKRLKEQLNKKGMTQKELSEKIGTTEVSVSRYVSGQRIPKASVVFKIATALGVSTDYLLGVEEKDGDGND